MNLDVTEREFQSAVVELAHLHGWHVAHFRTAMNARGHYQTPVGADGAGWPDLVLVNPDADDILFRELKAQKGRLSERQVEWLNRLTAAGADADVWRPKDWQRIQAELNVRGSR